MLRTQISTKSLRMHSWNFHGCEYSPGLAFACGSDTKMKRKLTLQILRALGVGKSTFSTGIEEEVETLLQYMERYLGHNFYIQVTVLILSHLSCAWQMSPLVTEWKTIAKEKLWFLFFWYSPLTFVRNVSWLFSDEKMGQWMFLLFWKFFPNLITSIYQ